MSCGSGQQHYFVWFGVMIMINACWLLYLLCYVNKAVAFSFQFQGGMAAFIWKQAEGGQGEPCQPAGVLQACRRFPSLCLAVLAHGVTSQRVRAIAACTCSSCRLLSSSIQAVPRCARKNRFLQICKFGIASSKSANKTWWKRERTGVQRMAAGPQLSANDAVS